MDGTDGAYYWSEWRPSLLVGWPGFDISPSRWMCENVVRLFSIDSDDFTDDSVLESIRDLMLAGF